MKSNKNKKILYGFGAVTTVVAPVLVTVACGSDDKTGLDAVTSEQLTKAMFPGVADYTGRLDPLKAKTENLTINTGKEIITGVNLVPNAQGEKIRDWQYTNTSVSYSAQLKAPSETEEFTKLVKIRNATDSALTATSMSLKDSSTPDFKTIYELIKKAEGDEDGNVITVSKSTTNIIYLVATDNNGFYKVTATPDGITSKSSFKPLFESPTGKWEKLFVGANNEISESAQMEIVAQDDTGNAKILITTEDKGFFLLSYDAGKFSVEPIPGINDPNLVITDPSQENEIGDDATIIPLAKESEIATEFLIFTPEVEEGDAGFILAFDSTTSEFKFTKSPMVISSSNPLAEALKLNKDDITESLSFTKLNEDTEGNSLDFLINTETEGLLKLTSSKKDATWEFSAEYLSGDTFTELFTKGSSSKYDMEEIMDDAILLPVINDSSPKKEFVLKLDIDNDDDDDEIPPEIIAAGDTYKLTYDTVKKTFTTESITTEDAKMEIWLEVLTGAKAKLGEKATFNFGSDKFLVWNSLEGGENGIPYLLTFFQHHYKFDD